MFILSEKLEDGNFRPIRNDWGFVSEIKTKLEADIERIYLQPDYENLLVIQQG